MLAENKIIFRGASRHAATTFFSVYASTVATLSRKN